MLTHDQYSNSRCDNFSTLEPSGRIKNSSAVFRDMMSFSSSSIVHSMEKFVRAMADMDETILVPSRLMDLKVDNPSDCNSIAGLMNLPDLYALYTTLHHMRRQLLWGETSEDEKSETGAPQIQPAAVAELSAGNRANNGKARRASVTSTGSLSEADSESVEHDSGYDAQVDSLPNSLDALKINFQKHLKGLADSLTQLTEAAEYVTKRYHTDVLSSVL